MANKVYFIQADDANGENQDLIVVAENPEAARKYWEDYYEGETEGCSLKVRIIPGVVPQRGPGPVTWEEVAIV